MSNKPNFGNFVRAQLNNPDSEISQAKRKWTAWKSLVKNNPDKYKISILSGFEKFILFDLTCVPCAGIFPSIIDNSCPMTVGELMRKES